MNHLGHFTLSLLLAGTIVIINRDPNWKTYVSFLIIPIFLGIINLLFFQPTVKKGFVFMTSFVLVGIVLSISSIIVSIYKKKGTRETVPVTTESIQEEFVVLKNSKGKKVFRSIAKNIMLFEANDNYVKIYHLDSSHTINKSLVRTSLKKVSDITAPLKQDFFRVHKSYIINLNSVSAIEGSSQSKKIKLKHIDFDVPVSRSFDINNIEEFLSNKNFT